MKMKAKRLPKKTRNKIKVFVLFLFLSICLGQAGTPKLSLTLPSFLHVILILVWFFAGLYLLGFLQGKKTGENRQGKEDDSY